MKKNGLKFENVSWVNSFSIEHLMHDGLSSDFKTKMTNRTSVVDLYLKIKKERSGFQTGEMNLTKNKPDLEIKW